MKQDKKITPTDLSARARFGCIKSHFWDYLYDDLFYDLFPGRQIFLFFFSIYQLIDDNGYQGCSTQYPAIPDLLSPETDVQPGLFIGKMNN